MGLEEVEMEVERWFIRDDFEPGSPDQIRAYMQLKGIYARPGKKAKTNKPSTDEGTLNKLAKKDPFFKHVLEFRGVGKMNSTYAEGVVKHADELDRIHPEFGHHPSTWRLSCRGPNVQNIPVIDDEDPDAMTTKFRSGIVAGPGCTLIEADYAGIEAVLTGWFAGDPDYMRLATLGIHSYLTSHKVGKPADLSWSTEKLGAYLAEIKSQYSGSQIYHALKRCVHLTNYGGTPFLMHAEYPELFPSLKAAEDTQAFYYQLCPKLHAWHADLRSRAAHQNFLGGKDHPFGLKHWFWDVITPGKKQAWDPGGDWNRVVAFYPQSTAAFIQADAVLRLTSPGAPYYVGDLWYGSTPLRALVHDSILAEVPIVNKARYLEALKVAMLMPVKTMDNIVIGVDVKEGPNWADMKKIASWPGSVQLAA